ncbi:MAG: hypothetical protein B7Y63_08625 [Sulfurovum sp. 35-42-20]|nr:MAG: hypothetical protein B7Y63_08625 [Sulfurovum sp. 35-42-20]
MDSLGFSEGSIRFTYPIKHLFFIPIVPMGMNILLQIYKTQNCYNYNRLCVITQEVHTGIYSKQKGIE